MEFAGDRKDRAVLNNVNCYVTVTVLSELFSEVVKF